LNSVTLYSTLAALITKKKEGTGAYINHNALYGFLCGAHSVFR